MAKKAPTKPTTTKKAAKAAPTPGTPGRWRSRIVGHDRVPPDQLLANPLNFRKHPQRQREALKGSIDQIGYIRSVTVNRVTGNLVDGHERVWQALTTDQPLIDVEYVELSPEEERLALASMDPISEMAMIDGPALESLLAEVSTGDPALMELFADLHSKACAAIVGEFADGAEEDPTEGQDESQDGYVNFSVPLSADQELIVRKAIRTAKQRFGSDSTGEALAKALADWTDNDQGE